MEVQQGGALSGISDLCSRGTRFSVVTPQISAAGVEHLDTILSRIQRRTRRGNPRRDFGLQEATITDSRYLDDKHYC